MKLYKSFLFSALAATAALATSCSDEGEWAAYPQDTAAYSFAQATNNYNLVPTDEIPDSIEVRVRRNNTGGEVTLPLIVEYSGSVLKADTLVTFAEGNNEATCFIHFLSEPVIGQTEEMTIAFDTLTEVSVTGNASMTVSFLLNYTWLPAGSCNFISGWEDTEGIVQIQRANEYEGNLYRLVSPYYVLAPDYCPNPGYHLQFYLDENYEPLGMPRFQNIGEESSYGGYWTFYYNPSAEYCSFTREGTLFTINGAWAYGDASMGYGLYNYATELFDWNDGYPGTVAAE